MVTKYYVECNKCKKHIYSEEMVYIFKCYRGAYCSVSCFATQNGKAFELNLNNAEKEYLRLKKEYVEEVKNNG